MHGTTVATNALLERKGARVALLTTEGHRDVIEMREGLKDDRYNVRMAPPVPLVPRAPPHRREGAHALRRHGGHGARRQPRSPRAVEAAGEARRRRRSPSATCTPIANAEHEVETGAALAKRLPGAYVSLSSDVLPQIKEYERVWTTVVNAYVGAGPVDLSVAPEREAEGRGRTPAT